jgi:DNA-binding transcriptional MerR regulator
MPLHCKSSAGSAVIPTNQPPAARPDRGPGGRRLYSDDALERLRFIARLKHLGLTLGEIGELNSSFVIGATPAMLQQLEQLLAVRTAQVSERIAELNQLLDELNHYRQRISDKTN